MVANHYSIRKGTGKYRHAGVCGEVCLPQAKGVIMTNGPRFLRRDGKAASDTDTADAEIVIVWSGLPKDILGYVFDAHDDLHGWAREVGQSEIVERLEEAAKKGREGRVRTDSVALEAWQKKRVARITAELNDIARMYGLPVTSPELLAKATTDADPLVGRVFDPWVLFDVAPGPSAPGCTGDWLPIEGLMPNLSWLGFDNRASAARGIGGALLFTEFWFEGRSKYLINNLGWSNGCRNLQRAGFGNAVSSAIAI
jgi:hypothetical protein